MKLSPLEQKMLRNIQLGVICVEIVDFTDLVTKDCKSLVTMVTEN